MYYRVRAYEADGKNYLSTESVVKRAAPEQKIKISPNPADNVINVYSPESDFSESRRIQVMDVSGKKVIDVAFTKQNMEVNVSNLVNGYYIVNISDKTKTESQQVLIKHQ